MPRTKKTAATTKKTVEINKKIGPRVKEARKRIGERIGEDYSQERLGRLLCCTNGMISQIEHGRRSLQRADAEKLSEKSGLRIEYLLGFDDFPTNDALHDDLKRQLGFYDAWRTSLLGLIANQLEYKISQDTCEEKKYYIFSDSWGRKIEVPQKDIDSFLDEYYDYAMFKIEQVIDKNRYKLYTSEKKDGQ